MRSAWNRRGTLSLVVFSVALSTLLLLGVERLRSDVRERGIAATRQLAKRQLTWLRSLPQRQRVACDAPDATRRCLHLAGAHWNGA